MEILSTLMGSCHEFIVPHDRAFTTRCQSGSAHCQARRGIIAGRGEHDQVSGNALTMPD
jgi:hypothetical protein